MNKDIKDFFISYNKADKEYAKWIAGTLEENDYTTYIQAWDFRPGNNFILQMQEAIKKSKRTIIVLSQNYLNSEYCQAEWAAAYNYDPTGKYRKLIPVRVSDVCPNGLLSGIIYIDLYRCDEEVAKKRLLNGIDENENPRMKPNFPVAVISESSSVVNLEFDFEINKGDIPIEISIKTENNITKWYCNRHKYGYFINISDMELYDLEKEIEYYDKKMDNNERLSQEEISRYNILAEKIEMRRKYIETKRNAIDFFLNNEFIQLRLYITNSTRLIKFIKNIIGYNYFERAKHPQEGYKKIEGELKIKTNEFRKYFVTYLDEEKLKENLKLFPNVYFSKFNADTLCDELFEIVVYDFLHFLGIEIAFYQNIGIKDNKEAIDLYRYVMYFNT